MAFPLAATGPIAKSLRGTAGLIAQTAQFQTETGKSEADSLNDHCFWPNLIVAARTGGENQQFVTAPLCLVTTDAGQAINRPYVELADGEVFVQLVLIPDTVTHTDPRDQYTDLCNRVDQIILEALREASKRNAQTQWNTVVSFHISQPPEENDLQEVQFEDANGDPIRVWVFPLIAAWRAD